MLSIDELDMSNTLVTSDIGTFPTDTTSILTDAAWVIHSLSHTVLKASLVLKYLVGIFF